MIVLPRRLLRCLALFEHPNPETHKNFKIISKIHFLKNMVVVSDGVSLFAYMIEHEYNPFQIEFSCLKKLAYAKYPKLEIGNGLALINGINRMNITMGQEIRIDQLIPDADSLSGVGANFQRPLIDRMASVSFFLTRNQDYQIHHNGNKPALCTFTDLSAIGVLCPFSHDTNEMEDQLNNSKRFRM